MVSISIESLRTPFWMGLCAVLLLLVAAGAGAQDGKLYKWVDENGNVTYQDRPPPEGGGQVETFVDPQPADEPGAALPDVDVTFYAIEVCDACDLVRDLLKENGVPFEEKDAEGSVEIQSELREVAGALSVPVVQIGDQVLKGYNRELLLNELEEAGFFAAGAGGQTAESGAPATGSEDQGGAASSPPPEDDDFAATFDEEEIFSDYEDDDGGGADDVTQWEEIPEDERINVTQ